MTREDIIDTIVLVLLFLVLLYGIGCNNPTAPSSGAAAVRVRQVSSVTKDTPEAQPAGPHSCEVQCFTAPCPPLPGCAQ